MWHPMQSTILQCYNEVVIAGTNQPFQLVTMMKSCNILGSISDMCTLGNKETLNNITEKMTKKIAG